MFAERHQPMVTTTTQKAMRQSEAARPRREEFNGTSAHVERRMRQGQEASRQSFFLRHDYEFALHTAMTGAAVFRASNVERTCVVNEELDDDVRASFRNHRVHAKRLDREAMKMVGRAEPEADLVALVDRDGCGCELKPRCSNVDRRNLVDVGSALAVLSPNAGRDRA